MTDLISAKEAREKINNNQTEESVKTITEVSKLIADAIDKNKCIILYKYLQPNIVNYLESKGYIVSNYSDCRESGSSISW